MRKNEKKKQRKKKTNCPQPFPVSGSHYNTQVLGARRRIKREGKSHLTLWRTLPIHAIPLYLFAHAVRMQCLHIFP